MMRLRVPPFVCLLTFTVALTAACAGGDPAMPQLEPRIAVHAVLDAQLSEQLILVEQTQVAQLERSQHFIPGDAIVSAGGQPVSDATVVLFGPLDSVVAVQDRAGRTDGRGAGLYRVRTAAVASGASSHATPGVLRLIPGALYRLEVRTATTTVTGTTRLPDVEAIADRATRTFNVDRDTLWLAQAARRQGAAAFFLRRVHAGFSRSERFERSIDAALLAPPPLPNVLSSSAPSSGVQSAAWAFAPWHSTIKPGTAQQFSVVAVDSNYLRYAVIGADPFGDDVQGNTLRGGVGLFGSLATLTDVTLELIADRDKAAEGDWVVVGNPSGMPTRIRLYESSRFPSADAGDGTTGAKSGSPSSGRTGFTGTAHFVTGMAMYVEAVQHADAVTLSLRAHGKSAVHSMRGELDGSTLTLFSDNSTAGVRYRLQ